MDDRTKWLQDIIKKTWAWPTMRSIEEKAEERQAIINGVFDISNSASYSLNITGVKPEAIIINEGEIIVRTWKEAAMRFFEVVSHICPNFMKTFSDNPEVLNSKLHPAISENELKLRIPEKIRNSEYYLETNASAMTLLKWIRKTCEYIKKNANNVGLTVKIKI